LNPDEQFRAAPDAGASKQPFPAGRFVKKGIRTKLLLIEDDEDIS